MLISLFYCVVFCSFLYTKRKATRPRPSRFSSMRDCGEEQVAPLERADGSLSGIVTTLRHRPGSFPSFDGRRPGRGKVQKPSQRRKQNAKTE